MRGMELMGYLSNSSTLDSIYLINKKHIGSLMINKYKNMNLNSYSERPVVDPEKKILLLHRLRTDTQSHITTLCCPNSNPNATFGQEQALTC